MVAITVRDVPDHVRDELAARAARAPQARVWALRANLSCYDAAYVAVAEAPDATLVTVDRRMAGAPGLKCRVVKPDT
jgi:hypothetical protein